ncbi:hypothetical protein DICA3_D23684 [Diutina catenulata]
MAMIQASERLIIPPTETGAKVLKTCVRCRQHKTKCDALVTNPMACTHCRKKKATCMLDTITKNANRPSSDTLERLSNDVEVLSAHVERLIARKSTMIDLLAKATGTVPTALTGPAEPGRKRAKNAAHGAETLSETQFETLRGFEFRKPPTDPTPPVSQIQSVLASPVSSPEYQSPESLRTDLFCTSANGEVAPFSLSIDEAHILLKNYETNFNPILPILPEDFFNTINFFTFIQENELLFWCIMLVSYLNTPLPGSATKYQHLGQHIPELVVAKCWLSTPRSVYTIAALLVLTTWPLPNNRSKISDNVSVKYISVMKSLALQFGLHKLEFISEFSHKTDVNVAREVNLNDLIRERMYKFININSNYWLIFLGLSNTNYNGFTQDYIINQATTKDLSTPRSDTDLYLNMLLKVSMVQSKLNCNMNDLIAADSEAFPGGDSVFSGYQANTARAINLHAYETILGDLQNHWRFPKGWAQMIGTSLEYSKLQVYIYSFAPQPSVTVAEYKRCVVRAVASSFAIVDALVESGLSYAQLPVHYRFPVELAVEVLLRVYKSPLLDSVNDYQLVKSKFRQAMGYIVDPRWSFATQRLASILRKFDAVDNRFIVAQSPSFFLIRRMKNYLVSSLTFEMIWIIYEYEKVGTNTPEADVDWKVHGVANEGVMQFFLRNESIFG